ncbi:hypothetical protein ABPG75_014043 [Micractinium tetrahymenae]
MQLFKKALPPWQRVRRALGHEPLAYANALLEAAPLRAPTARPSALQPLLKRGQHSQATLCTPCLSLCGTRLEDLPVDRSGKLGPLGLGGSSNGSSSGSSGSSGAVAHCHVSLGSTVKGVPRSGITERQPWVHAARACLYDGSRFHGAAQELRPRRVKAGARGTYTWCFDAAEATLLVRCPAELLPRAQLYIEFNVSYELTAEEAARLPPLLQRAARQVDEVCVAWALVSLSGLPTLHAARKLSVLLRGGPLARRLTLQQCAAAAVAAAAAAGLPGEAGTYPPAEVAGADIRDASLAVRLSPLSAADAAGAALLPAAAVLGLPAAKAVGCYRQLLAEVLATAEGPASLAPAGGAVLAGFPAILADADLSDAFFSLWKQATSPRKAKGAPPPPSTAAELAAAFRQCCAALWPLLGAQAQPPAGIANAAARRNERRGSIRQFLQQHPAVGLGAGAHAWLHRPFDAAELRAGPLEGLGATV